MASKTIKEEEEVNGRIYSDILRNGYDRCRRGYVYVHGLLDEQKRERTSRGFAKFIGRKQG